jgi:hypothetical protein
MAWIVHDATIALRLVAIAVALVSWLRSQREGPVPRSRGRKKKKKSTSATQNRRRWDTLPKATVSMEPKEFPLKTCPEGFVKLRRMSYGELLASNDMAFQVSVEAKQGSSDPQMGASMSSGRIAEYRFKCCVVDHNLENDAGTKLEFGNSQTVHLLDPNIGQEIDQLITDMHNWEKTFPNSEKPSSDTSSAANGQKSTTPEQLTSPSNS